MHFGPVRIDAELHLLNPEFLQAPGFRLVDHDSIRLHFHVESEAARILHNFQKILPHENFAAAEG